MAQETLNAPRRRDNGSAPPHFSPESRPVEVFQRRNGGLLRLGEFQTPEVTGLGPLQGRGLPTNEVFATDPSNSCEPSCKRFSGCQGGSCDYTHCRGDPACQNR